MRITLIYLQNEKDTWELVHETFIEDVDTLTDIAKNEAKVACIKHRWDWTLVKVAKCSIAPRIHEYPILILDEVIHFEYEFDHMDGEETFNEYEYIKQVRKDYANGIGNPFK